MSQVRSAQEHGQQAGVLREQREEKLLEQRKINAERIKIQVEEWMLRIPARMQQIVRYRYLEGMTREHVAANLVIHPEEPYQKMGFLFLVYNPCLPELK